MTKIINLNNGRSALDIGIKLLNLKKNTKILVPEILCDVAIKVFLNNHLNIVYYKLNHRFEPIWSELKKKNKKNIVAILMVHYFGYPQNINKFKEFTKKNKIFLIEDNCHSLDISFNNKKLGQHGDIGIDSPRKIINKLFSGGRLFINKDFKYNKFKINKYKPSFLQIFKKFINKNFPLLIKKIKFFGKRPNYESPFVFSNKDITFECMGIDDYSLNYLQKINKIKESQIRVNLFNRIKKFAKKNQIKSIFQIRKNYIPMYFVGISKTKNHSVEIFNWGWKNKIEIISWPSFEINTKLSKKLINRWKRYIIIPLNQDIRFIDEEKI